MATAGLGIGDSARGGEAVAGELRFLMSALADMQTRMQTLLSGIEAGLQPPSGGEAEAAEAASEPEADIEAPMAAVEGPAGACDQADPDDLGSDEAETMEAAAEYRSAAGEHGQQETHAGESDAPKPIIFAEFQKLAVTAGTDMVPAAIRLPVRAFEPACPVDESDVLIVSGAKPKATNVVVLADHARSRVRNAVGRTARWAAAIVLVVVAAAVAATGSGFAAEGAFLAVKRICAVGCSIVLGMP